MPRFKTLLMLLCLYSTFSYGQHVFNIPDYEAIKEATTDKNSPMYYPTLMNRYNSDDTTLDIQEYRMLYLGNFFQDSHKGFSDISIINDSLRAYNKKDTFTNEDYHGMIKWSKKFLEQNPFDLRKLYDVYNAYNAIGDSALARPYAVKLNNIIETILSTGDGLTSKSGFHVLAVGHEYFILNVLGFRFVSQTLTGDQCDYLEVAENEEGIKGIYFDINQIFAGYTDMFKDVKLTLPKDEKQKKKKQ